MSEGPVAQAPARSAGEIPRIPLPRERQMAGFASAPLRFLDQWRRELGDTFVLNLAVGDIVLISDPASIKRLFSGDRVHRLAPGRNLVLAPLLGSQSLLLQEGPEHLRRRKLMLPPFHGERMRAYEEIIRDSTRVAVAAWPHGTEFALYPSTQALTLDVILRAVFGVTDDARRERLRVTLIELLAATTVAPSGPEAEERIRRIAALRDRTDELLYEQIAEQRARDDLADRDDVLSLLVAARFDDGTGMDDSELRDQLMTLLLAGHETTASGLAWAFDLILHHPAVYEQLREEVAAGEHDYVDAVVDESLRLRPVVPFAGRRLGVETDLGGFRLPPDTVVLSAVYLAHTRADTYERPHEFRPERFLGGSRPETYSWIPFGGGTRRCIGAAFAELEMRVAIETIVSSVTLRPAAQSMERAARRSVTLSPAQGTRVTVAA